jgi:serine/threonine protein kinase
MIGSPPQPADQRGLHDKVDPALALALKLYSQQLVDIAHWCLKQNPLERPQSVFALQKALREPSSTPSVPVPSRPAGFSRWLDSLSNRRRATRSDSTVTWPTNKTPT